MVNDNIFIAKRSQSLLSPLDEESSARVAGRGSTYFSGTMKEFRPRASVYWTIQGEVYFNVE